MLVNAGASRRDDDTGSVLVVVLVIMLVLGIGGLASAAIVTSTTTGLAGSRGSAESRAAADAGLAATIADARRTGKICALDVTRTTAPAYRVTSVCAAGRVTFTATGTGQQGRTTKVQSVFEYTEAKTGEAGDMVFFGSTTFTREVRANTLDTDLLSIVIPTGDFTCMAAIPANIVVGGNFISQGGCTVDGSVVSGGALNMTNAPDTIKGNVTASGTGTNRLDGQINGTIHTKGDIDFGWAGKTYEKAVTSAGSINLNNAKLKGLVTLPSGKTLNVNQGQVLGGTNRPVAVAAPEAPVFDAWFDYAYSLANWQPYEGQNYTQIVLTTSGSGPWTCSTFNSWPATGWTNLSALTGPTVLDARACGNLSSNSGTTPVVTLKTNLVLLAKSYDLTSLTIKGATGVHPRLWMIVEDTTKDKKPTCSGGAGNIGINGTVISADITAMAYTPCTVSVAGMKNDSWRGSFYGGSFSYGGGLSFYGDPIALPGMPTNNVGGGTGTPMLGALLAQRDIP